MDLLTGKKVCVVRLEGTITDKADLPVYFGVVKEGVRDKLDALRKEGWFVMIVTGATKTTHGTRMAYKFLADEGIPYDDLFASFGLPPAERWIDDNAEKM